MYDEPLSELSEDGLKDESEYEDKPLLIDSELNEEQIEIDWVIIGIEEEFDVDELVSPSKLESTLLEAEGDAEIEKDELEGSIDELRLLATNAMFVEVLIIEGEFVQ